MGREIKRVPLDFDWPLNEVWSGFLNPHYTDLKDCPFCDASGLNAESKRIADDWYDFEQTGRRWCHSITQDEVDALIEAGRLMDFTHRTGPDGRWVNIEPKPVVTAAEVNEWSRRGIGHDSLSRWVCVEARAKRLGVWGKCDYCKGEGGLWRTPGAKAACEAWEPTEPPEGEGWQVWETVSEGSPVSPVFDTPDAVVEWLVEQGYNREGAAAFVDTGWAPSFMIQGGVIESGVDASRHNR